MKKSNNYNELVDEILMLKSKEVSLVKRRYKRESKNTQLDSEPKLLTNNSKNIKPKEDLTSTEGLFDWDFDDLINDSSIDFGRTLSPTEHQGDSDFGNVKFTIQGETSLTAIFRESFWNQDYNFLDIRKNSGFEIPTSSPDLGDQRQLDNIWSTSTTDLNIYGYF